MVRSNLPSSEGVFCGEELFDSVAPPVSLREVCVGLTGLEEISAELDPLDFTAVKNVLVSSVTGFIFSFAKTFSVAFSTSPETQPLGSVFSTSILMLLLIVLLCREFVLCGGAGGCLVFITDRLRTQFCLVFASSLAATDPETQGSQL